MTKLELEPRMFLTQVLGAQVYDQQVAMLESVRDNRRTAVVGANGTGKDFTAGRVVLWWLKFWQEQGEPAKVVVTAPTNRQVQEVVWRETRQAFFDATVPLGGRMLPRDAMWNLSDDTFAIGFSTDQPYSLQGFHSPHLLVIISEAHAMRQDDVDAIKRLNPERLLLTGNALSLAGELYEAVEHGRGGYNCIKISAFDSPNVAEKKLIIPGVVTWEDVQERALDYGEDSPLYRASVLAEFPSIWPNAIYPQLDRNKHVLPMRKDIGFEDGAIGVDYGTVHPSAVVAVSRDSTGRYWVRACWAENGGDVDALAYAVAQQSDDYGIKRHRVRIDPNQRGLADKFRWNAALLGDGSRANRIGLLTRLLNSGGIFFDVAGPGISELFAEMRAYHWEKQENATQEKWVPVRKNDDRVAALEYAIEELEGTNRQPLRRNVPMGRQQGAGFAWSSA